MPEDEADRDRLDAAYAALGEGDPHRALELIDDLLAELDDDAELQLLAGLALLDLDRAILAVDHLRRSVELDPDAADARAHLADALFRACRFEEAEAEARRATDEDPGVPLAHVVVGLSLERQGRLAKADAALARAAELDPESFAVPVRMTEAEFERHVAAAIDALPDPFREALDAVAISVEPTPPAELLLDEEPPLDPGLLGLFAGRPLTEQSSFDSGELPPRIYLFQRNLERLAETPDRLIDEIGVTLRHELGHYLGMDEAQIDAAGHA